MALGLTERGEKYADIIDKAAGRIPKAILFLGLASWLIFRGVTFVDGRHPIIGCITFGGAVLAAVASILLGTCLMAIAAAMLDSWEIGNVKSEFVGSVFAVVLVGTAIGLFFAEARDEIARQDAAGETTAAVAD